MTKQKFQPRLRWALMESLAAGAGLALFLGVGLYFLKGIKSLTFVGAWSFGCAAVLALFYALRFWLKAAQAVVISDAGVVVAWRGRSESSCDWQDVRKATHENRRGLCWVFDRGEETEFVLRDDGLSVGDWGEIACAVETQCRHHEIPTDRCGMASAFGLDDDGDFEN